MKKILIVFSLLVGFALVGCENFLDTKNLTKKDTSNFPSNEAEVQELITGAYRTAREAEIAPDYSRGGFLMSEIMSDDCLGAAGNTSLQDEIVADMEKFINREENFFAQAWSQSYSTIFRANTALEGIEMIEWGKPEDKNYATAQALFLRSYVLFYLARMFGTAPMPLASAPVNLPRASADEIFGQVAADLVKAIELMPATKRYGNDANRGRATKWAAQAILARAFLFYTGYYGKASIEMADEAGTLTKEQVIGYLEDCIDNSGHDLLPSFYSLWPYSNEITRNNGGYKWLDSVDPDRQIAWAGEQGGNIETIFAWQFRPGDQWECNRAILFMGMRMIDYSPQTDTQMKRTFPFGAGWGFCTVNTKLWETWPVNDPRREGSIINMNNPLEVEGYVPGADNWQMETGFMQKKYQPIIYKDNDGTYGNAGDMLNIYRNMYSSLVGAGDYQNTNAQDQVIVRFADVLLMHSELKQDVAGINRVRARVGLDPVGSYSVDALRNERRWELCFEGIRYFDLLRYGLDYAAAALNEQNGVTITNSDSPVGAIIATTTMQLGDLSGRLQQSGGFFPIPNQEIDKSDGVLVQTPGWSNN